MAKAHEVRRIRAALAASAHFRELAAEDVDRLAALGRIVELADGESAGRAGTRRREIWIVLKGTMRMSSVTASGREFVYAMLGPGSFYGIGSLLSNTRTLVDARAAGATSLVVIRGSDFLALLDERRWLWRHVAKLLHRRLTLAMTVVSDLALAPLSQRIVRRLLSQAMSGGHDLRAGARADLRVTQTDLARMLGISRSKVNTELKRLERDGLLSVRYRNVVLKDCRRLCELAGPQLFPF
jgi:CRP-like cAMP-binding protein